MRALLKKQKEEENYRDLVNDVRDNSKVEQAATWQQKTAVTIRNNLIRERVSDIVNTKRHAAIQERRKKLSDLLFAEKAMYEAELVELTRPNPRAEMEKMAKRASELKQHRENDRQQFVKEKLYQQWRESMDELRSADAELAQLETTVERTNQMDDREERERQLLKEDMVFDALWQEGYHAKVDREIKEKEVRTVLQGQMKETLQAQIDLKKQREADEKVLEGLEAEEMLAHFAAQEQEAVELVQREAAIAKSERAKIDLYKDLVEAEKKKEEEQELWEDKQFVLSVLAKEKKMSEREEQDKLDAKRKTLAFNEAMKKDMQRKAAGDELLIQLQNAEREAQWQKRFETWEKEEIARRNLLEDVYKGRAQQIEMKNQVREQQKQGVHLEREAMLKETERLEAVDRERARAEALLKKRHQEELFRQMDFHQVQRHRELQQHMLEQRQAMIAEEKFRQAKQAEMDKQADVLKKMEAWKKKKEEELAARKEIMKQNQSW